MGMLLDLFRNKWPYTDFHELNADWIISTVRELIETMDSFIQNESISFADPITWNISTQYAKATVVLDSAGNAYLSKQAVPAGIQLNNSEYWQEIFNFTTYTRTANRNLTFNVETDTTRATAAYSVDDWLILNDVLYKVTQPIAIDDTFIIAPATSSNIVHFTVEDFIKAWMTASTALINQYKDDIDASELAYRQELAQDISTTTASLQAQLNAAIAGATVDSEVINARVGADGTIYNTLGEAIRSQIESTLRTAAIATPIPADSDLDTYTTNGQYYISTASIASSIINYPNPQDLSSGQLIVLRPTRWAAGIQPKIQIYLTTSAHLYIRRGTTQNVYDPWQRIATKDMVDAVESALNEFKGDTFLLNATNALPAVATNDDLNSYLTPGQWRIPSQAISVSLKNRPYGFKQTGTLLIFNTHNNNHVYQVVISNGLTNIWLRHIMISTSVFDEWKSIVDANDNSFSWQRAGFLLHNPNEETREMIDCIEDYLNITITNTTDWVASTDGIANFSGTVIQSLWDELQSRFPAYIDSGEIIGYSKDQEGDNYAPIKAYKIHPRESYVSWEGPTYNISYEDMPTIYLCAGTHAERTPTWNLFTIFKRAFEQGTAYSDLLNHVKFVIIPCLDIWSYDHGKRYLAAAYDSDLNPKPEAIDPDTGEIKEMYDCNRQCICSDMSNPSYGNLQIRPFAYEAAALTSYVNNNGFTSNDIFIDLHNCSYSLGYEASYNSNLRLKFNAMIDELAKVWLEKSTFKNGDKVDYYASSTTDHNRQRGKILGRTPTATTYGWFFAAAYNSLSNLLEVQNFDVAVSSDYAIAKGLDMTYRWLETIHTIATE